MTTIGGHQASHLGTNVWLTPPYILERLGRFDLDPCAAPEPRPWPTATRHISPPEDGLTARWTGRVWLNPPYSREAAHWISRLAHHDDGGCALLYARTETAWFADYVWPYATGMLFLYGRIRFHLSDGTQGRDNGGAPSVLVAYRQDNNVLRRCGLRGKYVEL